MADKKVRILLPFDVLPLARDAKIVSLRWDLIPWSLVLDCDVPAKAGAETPLIRRAWIIFVGMSEISWSMKSARLPNGVIGTDALIASERVMGFCEYELPILTPTFLAEDGISGNPHNKILIRATGIVGAISVSEAVFDEFGPNRQQRESLATEEDFLQAISAAAATVSVTGDDNATMGM